MLLFVFLRGGFLFASTQRTRKEFLSHQSLLWLRGRTTGALRAERYTSTSAEWTSCSACHELLCSRAFLSIVLQSVQNPQTPHFLQIFGGIWPMPLSLLIHSALALFAQRQLVVFCAKAPLMAVSRLFLYRNAVVIALRTQSRERRHPPPRAMGGRSRIPFSEERVRRTVTNTAILTNYLFV